MNIQLTKLQAFVSMQYFIDQYYWKTRSDDLGAMCSCLMLVGDNTPADAAFEQDWLDSAKVIIPNYHEDTLITKAQAYAITKEFLELYCRIGFSDDVQKLIDAMMMDKHGCIINKEINLFWDNSVELATTNGPMYLQFLR